MQDSYDDYWDDWDDYYHDNHYYYDHHYYPAAAFIIIPTAVIVGTTTYYTSEGQYYSQVSNQGETGYVKVSTPAGYETATLPAGYKTIIADGKTYYVSNGTFYIKPQGEKHLYRGYPSLRDRSA